MSEVLHLPQQERRLSRITIVVDDKISPRLLDHFIPFLNEGSMLRYRAEAVEGVFADEVAE